MALDAGRPQGRSGHPRCIETLLVLSTILAPSVAAAASEAECRAFHQECEEARAAGWDDVGICNVERLECIGGRSQDAQQGVGKTMPPPPPTLPTGRPDPERSVGP
jgi:hypothetical protein